ncbi:MAG: hypothetical protein EBS53_16000 [Bacteroidetes bacterium]|nr:hypothetical protein [Bacteroidota bacterium]
MARKRIRDLDAQASITSTLKLAVDDTSLPEAKRISISQLDARYGAVGAPCYLEWFQVTGSHVSPIATQNVFELLNVTAATVGVSSSSCLTATAQGRVTNTGASAVFRVQANISVSGTNNEDIHIAVGLNGSVLAKSAQSAIMASGNKDTGIVSQCLVTLNTNEYVEIFVMNATSANSVTLGEANVIVEKIG